MKCRVSFILIAVILMGVLTGCNTEEKTDKAKAVADEFFQAIEEEDYTSAEALLHTDRPAAISDFIIALEKGLGVDFESGTEIVNYTATSTVLYDSTVEGSSTSLEMDILVGETPFAADITIVDNDEGYGIYDFNLTPVK